MTPIRGERTQASGTSPQRENWPSSLEGQTKGHCDQVEWWEMKVEQQAGVRVR